MRRGTKRNLFKRNLALTAALAVGLASVIYFAAPKFELASMFAGVLKAKSVQELLGRYATANTRVRIVLIPGHEPGGGGTEYRGIAERDLVVDIANKLADYLRKNPRFDVYVTRDKRKWNEPFASYFSGNWDVIAAWRESNRIDQEKLIAEGRFLSNEAVRHNFAPNDMAIRLHGINKWSNENDADIEIHLHINDYPRPHTNRPGVHTGFTTYIPDEQFKNSAVSRGVATAVRDRLARFYPLSSMPVESSGIVADQNLIAIGSYDSASAASFLIEYGYIYEPRFTNAKKRAATLDDLAYQTFLGLQDFFGASASSTLSAL